VVEMADQGNRYIPAHADAFEHPLPNFANRLKGQGPIKLVALGSSSTAGECDVVPLPTGCKHRCATNSRTA
jgi:hypothetical protein